jgi:hypothetical protein
MVKLRMEVTGIKELTGYFRELAREAPGKLTARTVRAGAEVILEEAKENIRGTFEEQTGALEDSGEVVVVNQFRADARFTAPYAAAQEYGLLEQPITDLQRAFFWWRYSETGDEMWRALALSMTYTIPTMPYLRPAIDSHQRAAAHVMAGVLRHEMVKLRPKTATVRGALNY